MRKSAIVLLVLLILLLAIPLGIGMAMGTCPECTPAHASSGLTLCLVLMVIVLIGLPSVFSTMQIRTSLLQPLLLPHRLERPPRLV